MGEADTSIPRFGKKTEGYQSIVIYTRSALTRAFHTEIQRQRPCVATRSMSADPSGRTQGSWPGPTLLHILIQITQRTENTRVITVVG